MCLRATFATSMHEHQAHQLQELSLLTKQSQKWGDYLCDQAENVHLRLTDGGILSPLFALMCSIALLTYFTSLQRKHEEVICFVCVCMCVHAYMRPSQLLHPFIH